MKIAAFVTFLIVSSGVCVFAQDESNWPEPDPIVWKVCDGAAEEPLAFARAGFKGATPKFEKGTTAVRIWTGVGRIAQSAISERMMLVFAAVRRADRGGHAQVFRSLSSATQR
jgi:hypothetical protein